MSPLPFESTLSVLMRFAWRNALNARHVRAICSARPGYVKHLFDHAEWLEAALIEEQTGWAIPTEHETRFMRSLERDQGMWAERRFRYCPLCLECGYHSYFFQLVPLSTCPLHHIELTSLCSNCGCETPDYRVGRALFDRPYRCLKCTASLAGGGPELDLHLWMREREQEIDTAFAPVADWVSRSDASRRDGYQLSRSDALDGMRTRNWCNPITLIRETVYASAPPPALFNLTAQPHPLQVSWRVTMQWPTPLVDIWSQNRPWHRRVAGPQQAYVCAIRRVRRWICERRRWSHQDFTRACSALKAQPVKEVAPELLALYYLRRQLEPPLSWAEPFEEPYVNLKEVPCVEMGTECGRLPRVAWRVLFLAMYAGWYLCVRRGRSMAHLEHPLPRDDAHLIYRSGSEVGEHDETSFGCVVFPYLDDIPRLFEKEGKH